MSRQKVNTHGGAVYLGFNLECSKVPQYCIRDGKVCAYRIKATGLFDTKSKESACGYMYYTGKRRECDPKACDKWQEELLGSCCWVRIYDEEEDKHGDECETSEYR